MKKIIQLFKKSLAARLMLVFGIAGFAIVSLIITIVFHGFSSQWKDNVMPHFVQYLDYINHDIGNPPNVERAQYLAQKLQMNIYIEGKGVSYSSSGESIDLTDITFHDRERKWRKLAKNALAGLDKEDQKLTFAEDDDRVVMRNQFDSYEVFFEISHKGKEAQTNKIRNWSLLCLLLIFILSFWQLRRMLKPVQDIKIGVQHMGKGELDYRVPIRSDNDLGELSANINQMATDIAQMLDAKRQLLLAVSHELRSPLTRAKIASQMLEDSNNKVRLQEDIMEMETLITEILETERMNTPHAVLHRTPINLVELIESVISELPANNVLFNCTQVQALETLFELDEKRLRLLMRNTIANAICHGAHGAQAPSVELAIDATNIEIKIRDHGPGIASEDLLHVTEPFYRADPSRTRDTGGFGIGLYLCKLIVAAHQGQMQISSEVGEGTCVRIRLPL
jgi:signal transduction histidine kinase